MLDTVKSRTRKLGNYIHEFGLSAAISIMIQRRLKYSDTLAIRIRGVSTTVHCRYADSDFECLRQVFRNPPLLDLPNREGVIVDVGANVGFASLIYANQYPSYRVISIEPDPANCQMFERNCGAYENVTLVRGAIWSSAQELALRDGGDGSWSRQVVPGHPAGARVMVHGLSMAQIVEMHNIERINLLKMDIEGSEKEVFSDPQSLIWLRHVDNLLIELHDRIVPGCSEALFTALEEMPHQVSQLANSEYLHVRFV